MLCPYGYNVPLMRACLFLPIAAAALAACASRVAIPDPSPSPALLPAPATATAPAAGAGGDASPAATPVIIASPTPTATPVTHVVAEGETLLSIAYDYGISLEALQAANPAVDPHFLSVGTLLVIPPPEGQAAVSATQLAPPPPAKVVVGVPACHQVPTGPLYCFVEVQNPGTDAIENISARLTLAGADGLPMATAIAYGALDLMPPGGSLPLAAVVEPAPAGDIAAVGVEILTADRVADANAGRARILDIPEHQAAAAGPRLTVSGQVHNPGDIPMAETWVAVALYDDAGVVVGYRKVALGALASGESRAFSCLAVSVAGAVDRYSILAEGRP
jgi:hypothetical protein